jgi:hypothetical protein
MNPLENPNPGVAPLKRASAIYKDSFPHKNKISSSDYTRILELVNSIAIEEMIYKGVAFKLPYSLGRIGIKKHKIKKRIVD